MINVYAPYIAVLLAIIVGICGYVLGHDTGVKKSATMMLAVLEAEGAIEFDKKGNLLPRK